ncbi:MAG: hypothetical protein JXA46_17385 [Dehalococcoidales bacterium]|nr:hypothetical protein [Dehalococcoidales bacterium]
MREENSGFTLQTDTPRSSDRVIRYRDKIILVVDKTLEVSIGDARIDLEETAEGNNLVIRRTGYPVSTQK